MTEITSSLMPFFGLIRVNGEERTTFLHNQLSNDINNLPIGQACLATYNTAKGRVIATVLVLKRENDLLLTIAADQSATLLKKLQMYVMRSKVKLEALPEWGISISVPSLSTSIPNKPQYVLNTTHKNNGWHIDMIDGSILQIGKLDQLPPYNEIVASNWYKHEINSGVPWICAATSETCVAQMLNLHQLGAVHFKKGCYPGQEIIARAQYRGQVKRGLVKLQVSTSVKDGEPIFNDSNEEVGLIINNVTNQQTKLALAVIKHSATAEPLHTKSAKLAIQEAFF